MWQINLYKIRTNLDQNTADELDAATIGWMLRFDRQINQLCV